MTNRYRPSGRRLAAGIVAMVLSACSSGPTSNATTAPSAVGATPTSSGAASSTYPNACKLLVPSEVQAWMHGVVGRGQGTASVCTFANKSGHAVTVRIEGPVVGFAVEMRAYHGHAFAGAGDAAFESSAQSLVAFVKGSTEVILASNTPLTANEVSGLEMLARDAAHRW
jgi:hypothetical protein